LTVHALSRTAHKWSEAGPPDVAAEARAIAVDHLRRLGRDEEADALE
jgi:hypothetical protein